ncbi:MAG: hypothetical protein HQ566_02485 [Candidatus Omnitrophica bacterium]|nr:hypothetical protein [Candidatus Omnitrophota bacterium]
MVKRIIVCALVFSISIFSAIPIATAQYEYQAELISLDLKGMDIKDVLKILSQKSGLNIVADKDVKGTVTLYVRDVEVMDALDIIVSTNSLAYEQEGTLITIMTNGKYEKLHGRRFRDKAKTEIVKLDYASASEVTKGIKEMKSKLGKIIPDDRSNTIVLIDNAENIKQMTDAISEMDVQLATEIFPLDYAKAEPIKDKLEKMVSPDIGSIRFDERTNKVVVQDTPAKIEDIKNVIEAFDEKTREVVIDAYIIQVTLADKYSYGIDWADVAQMADVRVTANTNISAGLSGTTPSTLTIASVGGNYATVISLLKTFGETNVLSRPRITVADREEAKILVGAKEVYVTSDVTTTSGGTYHTTDHVQFVDVGVRLKVTPEINREGYIKLKIRPEVSTADPTKTVTLTNPDGSTRTVVPYVTTSEVETTVLVKDNTTLIIGGLMKDTIVDHKEKVPFLSDIPLLGKLFSTTGKSKEKTELVIFLTPHIIEGDRTTGEAQFYLDEWKKKKAYGNIEKSDDLKFDASKMLDGKPAEAREDRGHAARRTRPKQQWETISLARSTKGPEPRYRTRKKSASSPVRGRTPYEDYFLAIRDEINAAAARQDVSGLKGEVDLQFTVDKEGFVTRGPVVLNNPDLTLVRSAVNCVKQVAPFPAFPRTMKKDEAEFSVVVRYE